MKVFDRQQLGKLYRPLQDSNGEDNGQVTIIGGSVLFHGAPLLSVKVASRIVDMVFFTSPEQSMSRVVDHLKSKLLSFIWVPWEDLEHYIEKSESVLIGPGFMRYTSEKSKNEVCDTACQITRKVTKNLLKSFPNKKWVIDAGSLQVMEPEWIPKNAVLTPNRKEFEMLFRVKLPKKGDKYYEIATKELVEIKAQQFKCTVVLKGRETLVCSQLYPSKKILGGNAGMTKGGTGDVQAGLTVALLAKNEPFLAASSAAYVVKAAADDLYKKVGVNYNADDLADQIPQTFQKLL